MRLPSGCKFRARCQFAVERCANEEPELREVGSHLARCWVTQAGVQLNATADAG